MVLYHSDLPLWPPLDPVLAPVATALFDPLRQPGWLSDPCLCLGRERARKRLQEEALRLPQVFYNQGLSSLCRSLSYVRAEH